MLPLLDISQNASYETYRFSLILLIKAEYIPSIDGEKAGLI